MAIIELKGLQMLAFESEKLKPIHLRRKNSPVTLCSKKINFKEVEMYHYDYFYSDMDSICKECLERLTK